MSDILIQGIQGFENVGKIPDILSRGPKREIMEVEWNINKSIDHN